MELKEIRQIMELMNKHNLSLFHLEREGVTIKLKRGMDADEVRAMMAMTRGNSSPMAPQAQEGPASVPAKTAAETGDEKEIASPMVGTIYCAPAPDAEPFVKVGDEVYEDTVVCIVEAMKVMNDIKAEVHGVITKVLVEDGTPVQYGQPLFLVAPA